MPSAWAISMAGCSEAKTRSGAGETGTWMSQFCTVASGTLAAESSCVEQPVSARTTAIPAAPAANRRAAQDQEDRERGCTASHSLPRGTPPRYRKVRMGRVSGSQTLLKAPLTVAVPRRNYTGFLGSHRMDRFRLAATRNTPAPGSTARVTHELPAVHLHELSTVLQGWL